MDKMTFFARTMHTPDDPARAELRAALRELSQALIPLHKSLIDTARTEYASFGLGEITGPAHLLRLIQEDPFFAWLKPTTALIVDIDELARVDFTDADAMEIAGRVDALFSPSAGSAFAERYLPMLQRDVDVAIGHAAVRKAAARLPRRP